MLSLKVEAILSTGTTVLTGPVVLVIFESIRIERVKRGSSLLRCEEERRRKRKREKERMCLGIYVEGVKGFL